MLTYLKGLGPAGKVAVAFGSYGWGRGGAEAVHRQHGGKKRDATGSAAAQR